MKTDDIDHLIISLLKENSRQTNTEIAKKVGLTEGAVRNRIAKLLQNNIIKRFTVDTVTASFFGLVMVKAKKDVKILLSEISSSKIARESYEISGEFDACVILEGEKLEDIDKKVDELRRLKSLSSTHTYISFRKWY